MKPFISAMRILTAIPVPGKDCDRAEDALYGFPLVGALLGSILWLLGSTNGKLPAMLVAALLVVAQTLLTRGFHLDGMADTADGFGGGFTKKRTLEIMKDSHVGAFGSMALVLTLLVKFALFGSLLGVGLAGSIYAAMVVSRTAMVFLCVTMDYARPNGTAAATVQNARWAHLLVALALCLVLLPLAGFKMLVLLPIGLLIAFLWGRYCNHRVDGITGDLLGASNELVEIAVLLTAFLLF